MQVQELWRYPVKSLQGKRLNETAVTVGGLQGDRRYAIFDLDTGLGLTARRVADLRGSRYEDVVDFEREQSSDWKAFEGPPGPFHDSSRTRVSLVSIGTIRSWDRRRFRANVLLAGEGEDELVGSRIRIGEATLDVGNKIQRCVMVTRPQPGGIDRDLDVLRAIARERSACLAVGALVGRPGIVRVGDELQPG